MSWTQLYKKKSMDCVNGTPPVYLLLPKCTESNEDIFLNILKKALARKTDVSDIDRSLKSAMDGEILSIRRKDISVDWKNLNSPSEQIRQAKLIGYWAVHNYPLLGTKLSGESYNAPERRNVEVKYEENLSLMNADEVDTFIFRKMKLRVIELSVSQSTWVKLKHFVKVPASVGKLNELKLTPKMKSFDIHKDSIENCWKALKFGRFPTEKPMSHSLNESVNVNVEQTLDSNTELVLSQPASSLSSYREIEENTMSGDGPRLAKRARLDCSPLENRTDSFGDSTIDSLRTVLLNIQNNIVNVSKWFDPTVAGHHDINGPERLHSMIFKQKDNEIARMKVFTEDLEKQIENLKIEKSSLSGQIKSKDSLISALQNGVSALQNGVEANSKLYLKSEDDLEASRKLIAQFQNTIETFESDAQKKMHEKNQKFEEQLQELMIKLAAAEEIRNELIQTNRKLEEESVGWKDYAMKKEKQLEEANSMIEIESGEKRKLEEELNNLQKEVTSMVPDLKKEIEKLSISLHEMAEKKEKLEKELNELKNSTANKESALNNQIHELIKNLAVAKMKVEMAEKNRRSDEELMNNLAVAEEMKNEAIQTNRKLEEESVGWKDYAMKKEKQLEEANSMIEIKSGDKRKLEQELHNLQKEVASMVPELKKEIEKLSISLHEMSEKNERLEEELYELKNSTANKESALNNQIRELVNNLAVAKMKVEIAEKNRRLDEDITEWNHTTNKEKKVEKAKTPSFFSGLPLPESLPLSENALTSEAVPLLKSLPLPESLPLPKIALTSKALNPETSPETLENRNESEVFQSKDAYLEELRQHLLTLTFGWIKFKKTKNCKWVPGFVYPPDKDGISRAQKVTLKGYVTNTKYIIFQFERNIPEEEKLSSDKAALSTLNKDLKCSYK